MKLWRLMTYDALAALAAGIVLGIVLVSIATWVLHRLSRD